MLQLENIVCTTHLGYVTRDEFEIQFADVFDQIVAHGRAAPINVVNPAALTHPRQLGVSTASSALAGPPEWTRQCGG